MDSGQEKKTYEILSFLVLAVLLGEAIAWQFIVEVPMVTDDPTRQSLLTYMGFLSPATFIFVLFDIYALSDKSRNPMRAWIAFGLILHLGAFFSVGLQFGNSYLDRSPDAETIGGAFKMGWLYGFMAPHHLAIMVYMFILLRRKTLTSEPKTQKVVKTSLAGLLSMTALALSLVVVLSFKYDLIWVQGESMAPTYHNGQVLVLDKDADVRRGEIAVFIPPQEWQTVYGGSERDEFVKRIVAIPGDTVSWDGEKWTINEKDTLVHSGDEDCAVKDFQDVIPEGFVFMAGDTTELSLDSRTIFCRGISDYLVPVDNIVRKGIVVNTF